MSGGSPRSAEMKRSNSRSISIGIDAGDAEAEAHRAVGGRAAALAQDRLVLRAGEADDIVDGEEVARVVEPGDQCQLLDEERLHLVGDAVGIVPDGVLPGQLLQVGLRGLARRHRLVGVFVAQLLEAEGDAARDLQRAGDGLRVLREQARHLGPALQVPFGVGLEAIAGFRNRALLADAGEHVGERLAAGVVVVGIVGGNQRRARLAGELVELAQAPALGAVVGEGGAEMDAAACGGRQRGEALGEIRRDPPRRQGDEDLALARRDHLLEGEMALPLDGAAVAGGEQAAQPAVGLAVGRIAGRLEAVRRDEPGADQQPDLVLLGRPMRPHHAGQRIAVGDADGGKPQLRRPLHHLLRVRRPPQEREIGRRHQLGVGGHGP